MRGAHRVLWGCLALLAPAFAAAASPGPAFDCARADKAAEKLICADPDLAALDRQIGNLYRTAVTQAGTNSSALKGEQRRWLAYRDGLCDAADSYNGSPSPDANRACLSQTLTLRRDQLRRLADKAFRPGVGPLCERAADLINAIPHDAPEFQAPLMSRMQAAGLIALSQPTQGISAQWQRDLHLDKDEWGEGGGIVRFGPQGEFIAPYAIQGTASCTYFKIFRANGQGGYTTVPQPDTRDGGYCVTERAVFGTVADKPAFITETITPAQESWFFRLADGAAKKNPWGSSCSITIDYAMAYRLGRVGCADEAVCQAVRDNAVTWAEGVASWDEKEQTPYPRLSGLSPLGKTPAPPRTAGQSVPEVGGFQRNGLSDFADAAPYRLWNSPTGPLLVLVSKAHLGWRDSDDVLIGVWRLDGDTLQPLVGAEVIDTRLSIKSRHRVNATLAP